MNARVIISVPVSMELSFLPFGHSFGIALRDHSKSSFALLRLGV